MEAVNPVRNNNALTGVGDNDGRGNRVVGERVFKKCFIFQACFHFLKINDKLLVCKILF